MAASFDRRIVPEPLVRMLQAARTLGTWHLGGGAALGAVHLMHRLSRDLDVFVHDARTHRELVRSLPALLQTLGLGCRLLRDGGTFVRMSVSGAERAFELDLVFEPAVDLKPPVEVEGILTESHLDLRAAKLTCLLSRSEPRDLVDILFLERQGFRPEEDFQAALKKDAGLDPAILAWLLATFPTAPLPEMLESLSEDELRAYRDTLAERFRKLAIPGQS